MRKNWESYSSNTPPRSRRKAASRKLPGKKSSPAVLLALSVNAFFTGVFHFFDEALHEHAVPDQREIEQLEGRVWDAHFGPAIVLLEHAHGHFIDVLELPGDHAERLLHRIGLDFFILVVRHEPVDVVVHFVALGAGGLHHDLRLPGPAPGPSDLYLYPRLQALHPVLQGQ